MIPTHFDYHRAASIDEAIRKLQAGGKLLAGGHSLVPLMKLRLSEPGVLIDIARIAELSGIRERDGKIEIGATTVHSDVASSALLREKCPMIGDAAGEIGDPQVRNRGTLGGSLAHSDPSADYPAVMLAIDADINLRGPKGARSVKASAFFQDLFTVDLAADELIVSVTFAAAKASAYAKLHQRASHYAIVGVGAVLDVKNGVIQSARLGLTGACAHATRMTNVEQALAGQPLSVKTIEAASKLAGAGLKDVNADIHAGEEYRRAMIPVFTRRALEAAMKRA
ncbi:MAG: xanthine dehydrogenase family protein subunit M [Vicinamibacterales bacterium]